METVHLKINSKIYEYVMCLLKQFNSDDFQIVSDEFWKVKAEVNESFRQITSGEVDSISLEEFEKETDELLRKYES